MYWTPTVSRLLKMQLLNMRKFRNVIINRQILNSTNIHLQSFGGHFTTYSYHQIAIPFLTHLIQVSQVSTHKGTAGDSVMIHVHCRPADTILIDNHFLLHAWKGAYTNHISLEKQEQHGNNRWLTWIWSWAYNLQSENNKCTLCSFWSLNQWMVFPAKFNQFLSSLYSPTKSCWSTWA